MDTIYAATFTQRRTAATTIRSAFAPLVSFIVEVLVQGARGDDFERTFSSTPRAQFAALPNSSKQRLLDRGFRP